MSSKTTSTTGNLDNLGNQGNQGNQGNLGNLGATGTRGTAGTQGMTGSQGRLDIRQDNTLPITRPKTPWLRGSLVALVTPFEDGKVDEEALRALVRWHLAAGTDGLVACGTTGEAATLSTAEWERVVAVTVEEVRRGGAGGAAGGGAGGAVGGGALGAGGAGGAVGGGVGGAGGAGRRIPVVAGTGGNNTAATVERTRRAQALGADAALVVTPYYNKPTQEGLVRHYEAVLGGAPGMPLVLYNVPGRTGCNLLPDTVARLADRPGIVGVKEASGSMDQITELIGKVGDRVAVLSGDDGMNLFVWCAGGTGAISVLGNVAPRESAALFGALEAGDLAEARRLHHRYHRLIKMLFVETNPLPVKTALALMGRVREEFRLPLCEMSAPNREKLRQTLAEYGLL